jgi:hypothetical protein
MSAHRRSSAIAGIPAVSIVIALVGVGCSQPSVLATASGDPSPPRPPIASVTPGSTATPTNAERPSATPDPTALASPVEYTVRIEVLPGRMRTVRVVDVSGWLLDAREATDAEISEVIRLEHLDLDIWTATLRDDRHALVLAWRNGICDLNETASIGPGVGSIEVRQAPRHGCDAMGSGSRILLTFDRAIDDNAIAVRLFEARVVPAS